MRRNLCFDPFKVVSTVKFIIGDSTTCWNQAMYTKTTRRESDEEDDLPGIKSRTDRRRNSTHAAARGRHVGGGWAHGRRVIRRTGVEFFGVGRRKLPRLMVWVVR